MLMHKMPFRYLYFWNLFFLLKVMDSDWVDETFFGNRMAQMRVARFYRGLQNLDDLENSFTLVEQHDLESNGGLTI